MSLHDATLRSFASDNYAGIHPQVLAAITDANGGHQPAYGADLYTERLASQIREEFGEQAEVFPVFNGTGANVLALTSAMPRWGAVICASSAHINTDENAAPERVSGLKLLTVDTPDGKLTPELVDVQAGGRGDEHRAQPLVVSITQSSELGTVYTPHELRALAEHVHAKGMRLHVDGARLANAAASLGVSLQAITTDVGVDLLSFGGTKNGAMGAEAIVVLQPEASDGLLYLRKMTMQLGSKMRFVSAQLSALLDDELWLRNASHANAMAARLRGTLDVAIGVGEAPGLSFTQPTQVNALFARLPHGVAGRLRERFRFYDWNEQLGEVRWMTSFDTTEADVDAFADAICAELAR